MFSKYTVLGDARLAKAEIKSTIGGNLRLRVPDAMKLITGGLLKTATRKNINPFYKVEEIPAPIVSAKQLLHSLN